jgi:hypothetical protein
MLFSAWIERTGIFPVGLQPRLAICPVPKTLVGDQGKRGIIPDRYLTGKRLTIVSSKL